MLGAAFAERGDQVEGARIGYQVAIGDRFEVRDVGAIIPQNSHVAVIVVAEEVVPVETVVRTAIGLFAG